jgi:hypothetical protein
MRSKTAPVWRKGDFFVSKLIPLHPVPSFESAYEDWNQKHRDLGEAISLQGAAIRRVQRAHRNRMIGAFMAGMFVAAAWAHFFGAP